jgi:hypothetical protein
MWTREAIEHSKWSSKDNSREDSEDQNAERNVERKALLRGSEGDQDSVGKQTVSHLRDNLAENLSTFCPFPESCMRLGWQELAGSSAVGLFKAAQHSGMTRTWMANLSHIHMNIGNQNQSKNVESSFSARKEACVRC